MNKREAPGRGRVQIIALAVMFFGPAIIAWAMVVSDWRPGGTTNHGVIIEPPVHQSAAEWRMSGGASVADSWFTGHWTWIVPVAGDCGSTCAALLDELRRVRIALDKDADRVSVVLLQPPDAGTLSADAHFPGLEPVTAPRAAVMRLLGQAPGQEPEGRALFVVDYLGFRMMTYPLPLEGSHLLDDMEQLLKLASEKVENYQQLQKNGSASLH